MRQVQQLYFDRGDMHCPRHGHDYIHFGSTSDTGSTLGWFCAATTSTGHCMQSAEWSSLEEIKDPELESIARNMLKIEHGASAYGMPGKLSATGLTLVPKRFSKAG